MRNFAIGAVAALIAFTWHVDDAFAKQQRDAMIEPEFRQEVEHRGLIQQIAAAPFNAYSIGTLGGNCATWGAVLFQSANGLSICLAPGGVGQVLESQGTGANLNWASVTTTGSSTQNLFWATPNGSSGAPSLRSIVVADLPYVPVNKAGDTMSGGLTINPASGANAALTTTQTNVSAVSPPFFYNTETVNNGANAGAGGTVWGHRFDMETNNTNALGNYGGAVFQSNTSVTPQYQVGDNFIVGAGSLASASANQNGVETSLSGTFSGGASTLTIASGTGIHVNDSIQIKLDAGYTLQTTAQTGTTGTTLVISPALPSQATSGNAVWASHGVLQGMLLQSDAAAGATHLNWIIGASASAYSGTGSSFFGRAELSLERDVPSLVNADQWDTFVSMTAQSGVTALPNYGFLVGDQFGLWPFQATASWARIGGTSATVYSIANIIDASLTNVTGNMLAWQNSSNPYKITGSGQAFLGGLIQAKGAFEALNLWDTHSGSCTDGSLKRATGDGAGDVIWQTNTAAGCDFSSGTSIFELTPTSVKLPAISTAGMGCFDASGAPTSSSTGCAGLSAPQISVFSTHGTGTYTTPAGTLYLKIRMVGAGGGSSGNGSGATGGAAATATWFNTSGTYVANGGPQGPLYTASAPTAATASGCDLNTTGPLGNSPSVESGAVAGLSGRGPQGGSSYLGGGGGYGGYNNGSSNQLPGAGQSPGGGAGGPLLSSTVNNSWGGGAGAYCEKLITSPAGSYSYQVGTGGTAGTAGTGGTNGAAGADGELIVEAFFR